MKKISFIDYCFTIAIMTVIFGTIYAIVQQSYRTGANDPQLQIVRNINRDLQQGKQVESIFSDTIDIAQSLTPFVAFYDASGEPLYSSGYINKRMPVMPKGVFDFARKYGEHQVTWQPRPGVRMAMVIAFSNLSPISFVASGRSLVEVEAREHNLVTMIFFGWIICAALVLLHGGIRFYLSAKFKVI